MARSVAMQSAQDNPHIQEALRQRQERQDCGSLCDDSELDLFPDDLVLQILTPEQEAEIRSAWAQFDTNGDGELCVPCCAARALALHARLRSTTPVRGSTRPRPPKPAAVSRRSVPRSDFSDLKQLIRRLGMQKQVRLRGSWARGCAHARACACSCGGGGGGGGVGTSGLAGA